ncbi:MAG: MlaD family protein [Burkholderiaceae bacterium]|nr:MlaD family protein [Burkholderiaceae bacterium]MCD8516144.1 MlaD family protein [Burkholderiaceae bacterium]MCD8537827.1 MlaD family protein [Burkholderiaceae bacterium]MCD8566151.1 MlaD family protein [Burkholderiaceae bacterium]
MTDLTPGNQTAPPRPKVGHRHKRHLAWVWVVPIVAALTGASIVWNEWASRGPVIKISFESASGIEEGKTHIKFRDVVVGLVTDIQLSKSRESVVVTAQLDKDAESLANDGSQFWVVKPTIGVTGISGLATLFSGSYIEVDTKAPGDAKPNQYDFVGLEMPPPITSDRPGATFKLRAPTLGSIQTGTPVYFLRIPVGVVTDYDLDKAGKHVDIDVFVHDPYDKYVNANTRFWNDSGVQVGLGPNGLQVHVGSLASLLSGGISFASFGPDAPVAEDFVFKLFESRHLAKSVPEGPNVPIEMRFNQSTRGLEVGSAIDFHGVQIGVVDTVELDLDPSDNSFYTRVKATLYPAMLGAAYEHIQVKERDPQTLARLVQQAIDLGMRAQLQQGSLLTGGLYIELVNRVGTPTGPAFDGSLPVQIPTVSSQTFDDLKRQISEIIDHIDKIPFEKIGKDLEDSLKELTAVGRSVNKTLTPELTETLQKLQGTLDDVNRILASSDELPAQVGQAIQDLDEVLRSTRQFVDELRERPNSLLFGEPTTSYSRETLGAEK